MTPRVPVALPWYERREYPALLAMFSDPDKMPKTFDKWLEHAERVEKRLEAAGFDVVRISIHAGPFAAWCAERGVLPDQRARLTFANEAARARHSKLA
jgi:hypothetical protein